MSNQGGGVLVSRVRCWEGFGGGGRVAIQGREGTNLVVSRKKEKRQR